MERQAQQRINEQIRITPIRVVGAEGAQLGIMPTDEALSLARSEGFDLVEVAAASRPPVCRIMDYGKFKYEQRKRKHKNHAHQTKTKEIRLRPKIGEHDVDFKVKQARDFLGHKDKVRISMLFRGRENAHVDEGRKVVQSVIAKLDDVAKVESGPSQEGRRIVCTLTPR